MKKTTKHRMSRLYEGRKTSIWDKITGRRHHRLSASVTGEGDWEVEVPQIRMSRAFAVMLVLHVIAVGGLFAYRIWGRDEEPKAGADTAQVSAAAAVEKASPISAPVAPAAPATPETPAPAMEAKTYTWRAGDSVQLIAARFGVSTSALREANPDKTLVPGAEVTIPRAGRVFGGAEVGEPVNQPAAIFDPAKLTASAAPEPPAPRAVEVPEDAGSRVPDAVPPPAREAAVHIQPVTSRPTAKETVAKATESKKAAPESKKAETKKTEKSALISSSTPKPPARTAGQRVHVVAKGDTVYNLARKFGFSPDEIAKANGLKEYRINPGQQLKIPVKR